MAKSNDEGGRGGKKRAKHVIPRQARYKSGRTTLQMPDGSRVKLRHLRRYN